MRASVFLPLALLACSAPEGSPPVPPDRTHDATTGEPFDLRGRWEVSRLDGKSLDHRIPLTGIANALTWEPSCAGQGILYRTEGETLVFHTEPSDEPQIVCDIGYPDDLPEVIEALEGRWQVARTDRGDIVLTRGDETITLEKTPVETVETLAGEWRVAGIDGAALDEPVGIALSADDSEIWWEPRCAGAIVAYRIVNERFIQVEYPEPSPRPPGAEPAPPPPVCAVAVPRSLDEAMTAIRAADRIERTRSNGVLLSGGGRSITLFSQ
jgi:hypothetical protein